MQFFLLYKSGGKKTSPMVRDANPNVSSYESHPASGQLATHSGRNDETDPTNHKISLNILLSNKGLVQKPLDDGRADAILSFFLPGGAAGSKQILPNCPAISTVDIEFVMVALGSTVGKMDFLLAALPSLGLENGLPRRPAVSVIDNGSCSGAPVMIRVGLGFVLVLLLSLVSKNHSAWRSAVNKVENRP
jgi:hypothetical protein